MQHLFSKFNIILITSADNVRDIIFSVVFVCLFVCHGDNSNSILAIGMKLSGYVVTVPEEITFNFGDDPDIRPDIRFINFLTICPTIKMRP